MIHKPTIKSCKFSFLVYVDPVIQRHLPGFPPYHDVIANLSGCLINSHSIYEVPMPRIPTFINILGSMIPKNVRPLPKAEHWISDIDIRTINFRILTLKCVLI